MEEEYADVDELVSRSVIKIKFRFITINIFNSSGLFTLVYKTFFPY